MKKIITLLLVLLTLCACSGGNKPEGGEGTSEVTKISVACSPTPHAEILNKAKEILADKGIELEVVEFEDYVQPIEVVESGDIDANYFAHVPYLNNYNAEHGTNQVVVGKIHYEPFGLYAGKKDNLNDLADGGVLTHAGGTALEETAGVDGCAADTAARFLVYRNTFTGKG